MAVTGIGAGGDDADLVAAIASKDDDAAQKFVDERQGRRRREYRGVEYRYKADDDLAAAVVDHAVLVGTERALQVGDRRAVGRLAGERRRRSRRRATTVGTDGLGFVYADPAGSSTSRSARRGSGALKRRRRAVVQVFKGLLTGSGLQSVAAKLDVASNALRVDAAAIGAEGGRERAATAPARGGRRCRRARG